MIFFLPKRIFFDYNTPLEIQLVIRGNKPRKKYPLPEVKREHSQ